MSVICLNCEGLGCEACAAARLADKGGEQGLSPLEVERDSWRRRALRAEDDRDLAEKLVVEQRELLITLKTERDTLLAELALLRAPGGAA